MNRATVHEAQSRCTERILRNPGGALALGSYVCAIGFVCAVAHHYRNQALARDAHRALLYQISAVGASLLIGILYGVATSTPDLAWYWTAGPSVLGFVALMGFALSRLLRVLACPPDAADCRRICDGV